MPEYMTVVPAYGRDYKSKKEVQADWDAGKDFLIQTFGPNHGRYINKQDAGNLKPSGGLVLNVRFKRLANVHVIRIV